MTTIEKFNNGTEMTVAEKQQYATLLADASLLPKQYQRQPANVLLAIELGESLAIPPIQAINEVHVIEGKPSASANLIGGLVRRAGHMLRVRADRDALTATAQIVRHDDPDFTFEVTWTMEDAKRAGVLGKNNWKNFPLAMLKARAITEVAREACPEALMGIAYTPEELGVVVDQDGNPVGPQRPAPMPAGRGAGKPKSVKSKAADRDWIEELNQCETSEQVKQLAGEITAAGAATDEIKTAINEAWQALRDGEQKQDGPAADPVTGEVIEGEVA